MNEKVSGLEPSESKQIALKKTLDIISGKWRLYIIYQLGNEARRYGELRRMIPDVSEKVLIQELKALTSLGVVEKKAYNEVPPRVEYRLTVKGRQVLPSLLDLTTIGEVFLDPPTDGQ
ncbi:helix-turn-helix domain-containing protein [soil metagenome]